MVALEFYGKTWIYRGLPDLGQGANTVDKPVNRASPNSPTGQFQPPPSFSRSLFATFTCQKQVFAVFSGTNMQTDFMAKDKLLVSACDQEQIKRK